jgi:cyanophycinase-like exopeptidase
MRLTQAGPLRWRAGAGWLILAGGGRWEENETGEVDAAALGWADLDQPTALLPTAGISTVQGEALLDYYADLGGANGYVVPIFDAAGAQYQENCHLLEQAGLIYVSDGPDALGLVRALRGSPALRALARAFDDGAAIVGMGAGAIALGAWLADSNNPERAEPGWGWLPDVIIQPCFMGTKSAGQLRNLLNIQSACLGLGIPEQSALALGPAGEVASVGPGQVTVVLGGALSAPPSQ